MISEDGHIQNQQESSSQFQNVYQSLYLEIPCFSYQDKKNDPIVEGPVKLPKPKLKMRTYEFYVRHPLGSPTSGDPNPQWGVCGEESFRTNTSYLSVKLRINPCYG